MILWSGFWGSLFLAQAQRGAKAEATAQALPLAAVAVAWRAGWSRWGGVITDPPTFHMLPVVLRGIVEVGGVGFPPLAQFEILLLQ